MNFSYFHFLFGSVVSSLFGFETKKVKHFSEATSELLNLRNETLDIAFIKYENFFDSVDLRMKLLFIKVDPLPKFGTNQ